MPEFTLKKYKADVRDAAVSALNKMAARIKTRVSTALRQKYNLRKADVDQHIKIVKANKTNMTIEIYAGKEKIGLDHYGNVTRGTTGVRVEIIKGKPVEVRIYPSSGYKFKNRKGFKDIRYPANMNVPAKEGIGTFTAPRAVGKVFGIGATAVFAREGSAKNPVHRVMGPSIADLGASRYISKIIKDVYDSDFPKLLEHEILYYTKLR